MAFLARLMNNGEITVEELDEDPQYIDPHPYDPSAYSYQYGYNFAIAKFIKTGYIPISWYELALEFKDTPFHAGVLAAIQEIRQNHEICNQS